MSAQQLSPLVLSTESLRVHQGEFVYLVGVYKELNVAKKSTVTRYVGRAYLELIGGGAVVLETDEKGIRTPEEIEKYRDKTVVIYGHARTNQTVWGGGQVASLVMNAVSGFTEIDIVNASDFSPYFDSSTQLLPIYIKSDLKEELIGQWVQIEGELTTAKASTAIMEQEEIDELKKLGLDTSIFIDMKRMQQEVAEMNKMFRLIDYDLNTAIELGDHSIVKFKDTQPSELLDSNNIGCKLSIIGRLQGIPPYGCYLTEIQKVVTIDTSSPPLIQTRTDIDRYDGERVVVIGKYAEINMSQHPKRTVYIGRVALNLADDSSVALEVDDKGIRSKQELATCKNKTVRVVGILHSQQQLWGGANEAAILSPCLMNIEAIEVID